MNRTRTVLSPALAVVCLMAFGGCSLLPDRLQPSRVLPEGWFEEDDYRDAQEMPPPNVPDGLSDDRVRDAMAIPDLPPQLTDPEELAEPPRPEGLLGAGPDPTSVKLQRLADRQWLVSGAPATDVWPEVKQFLTDNGIAIAREDPDRGTIETAWIMVDRVRYRDDIRRALVEASDRDPGTQFRDKFRFSVEGAVRRGSSEVHVRHYATVEYQDGFVQDWPLRSTHPSAEHTVLRALAEYLASGTTTPAVSFMAQAIRTQPKARLLADRSGQPALHLFLDVDRAWATVGQSLTNAGIEVLQSDSERRVFEIDFDPNQNEESRPGFLSRVNPFSARGRKRELLLKLQPSDQGYFVRVFRDADSLADADMARVVLEVLSDHAS